MMNGFQGKFAVIASLQLLILLGDLPETPGLIPVGGKELYAGSRKTFSRKEGCFGIGCQRMDLLHDKGSRILGLNLRSLQPPPSHTKDPVHGWSVPPPPAQQVSSTHSKTI